MLRRSYIILALIAGCCLAQSVLSAPVYSNLPKHIRQGAVGIKFGIINSGVITYSGRPTIDDTVDVTDHKLDLDAAGCGGVFFDVPVYRKFALVFSADIYDIRRKQLSERFIDVATGFKIVFYDQQRRIAFRPGAAVGLGYLADIGFMRPTTYLTLKAFTDFVIFPKGKWAIVLDMGWVAAPTGGNSTVDVTADPSFYLRAGLLY